MINSSKAGTKAELAGIAGTIVMVGNPNVGKSTVFRKLCRKNIRVETPRDSFIELSYGKLNLNGKLYKVIDVPGINSLFGNSEEEIIARDLILQESNSIILQVLDAKNLKRDLILSCEIIELGKPMVLALNMMDEALLKGIVIDEQTLAANLGVDVVMTIANEQEGISELKKSLVCPRVSQNHTRYSDYLEESISQIQNLPHHNGFLNRLFVLQLFSDNSQVMEYVRGTFLSDNELEQASQIVSRTKRRNRISLQLDIIHHRVERATEIEDLSTRILPVKKRPFLEKLSSYSCHPLYGLPILLVVLALLYVFVGKIGAEFLADYIQINVIGKLLVPLAENLLRYIPSQLVYDAFLGNYGLITIGVMAGIGIVLPIICTFFFAYSLLEDSGYLSRVGILFNALFEKMGLNGKAAMPLFLGFSCVTVASLSVRALDTKKERIIAILLLWIGIPCSGQLSIYAAILATISLKAVLVLTGVVVFQLLLVGILAARFIPGEKSGLFMELHPIRLPNIKYTFSKTLMRVKAFLREVIPLFFLASIILFTLDKIKVLQYIEAAGKPLVSGLLGLPPQLTEIFILSFIKREAGAAVLKTVADTGLLSEIQVIVALVVMTLMIPCLTSVLIVVKEYGLKVAGSIGAFVLAYAFLIGIITNKILHVVY